MSVTLFSVIAMMMEERDARARAGQAKFAVWFVQVCSGLVA